MRHAKPRKLSWPGALLIAVSPEVQTKLSKFVRKRRGMLATPRYAFMYPVISEPVVYMKPVHNYLSKIIVDFGVRVAWWDFLAGDPLPSKM